MFRVLRKSVLRNCNTMSYNLTIFPTMRVSFWTTSPCRLVFGRWEKNVDWIFMIKQRVFFLLDVLRQQWWNFVSEQSLIIFPDLSFDFSCGLWIKFLVTQYLFQLKVLHSGQILKYTHDGWSQGVYFDHTETLFQHWFQLHMYLDGLSPLATSVILCISFSLSSSSTELENSSLLTPWRSRNGRAGFSDGSKTPFSYWKSSIAARGSEQFVNNSRR